MPPERFRDSRWRMYRLIGAAGRADPARVSRADEPVMWACAPEGRRGSGILAACSLPLIRAARRGRTASAGCDHLADDDGLLGNGIVQVLRPANGPEGRSS